jgi:hypothetical protein
MSHLINIFVEPGKTFAELKEKPTFWLPLILLTVLSVVMTLSYFNTVDSDWLTEHQLAASGKEMSASEIAQAKSVMPSASVMGIFGAVATPIVIAFFTLLIALYYMLAGKITGSAISFRHGLSLTAWAGVPAQLGILVAIVGVFMMEPQTGLESLMLTNFDPLIVQLPFDHTWSGLAKGFNLLTFWTIALTALGWRVWSRSSWTQAIVVATIPSLIIFGGMAVFTLATH